MAPSNTSMTTTSDKTAAITTRPQRISDQAMVQLTSEAHCARRQRKDQAPILLITIVIKEVAHAFSVPRRHFADAWTLVFYPRGVERVSTGTLRACALILIVLSDPLH